jgi:hypothetical protein
MTYLLGATVVNREARIKEVAARADAFPRLTTELEHSRPRMHNDGTVVVHGDGAGFHWAGLTRLGGCPSPPPS